MSITPEPLNFEDSRTAIDELTDEILKYTGSSSVNPAFTARDLGFPEHTAINRAVRPILARYAAQVAISFYGRKP